MLKHLFLFFTWAARLQISSPKWARKEPCAVYFVNDLLNVWGSFCLIFLIHLNRQQRGPEMWRETIFAQHYLQWYLKKVKMPIVLLKWREVTKRCRLTTWAALRCRSLRFSLLGGYTKYFSSLTLKWRQCHK